MNSSVFSAGPSCTSGSNTIVGEHEAGKGAHRCHMTEHGTSRHDRKRRAAHLAVTDTVGRMFGRARLSERRCNACGTAWLLTSGQALSLAAAPAGPGAEGLGQSGSCLASPKVPSFLQRRARS